MSQALVCDQCQGVIGDPTVVRRYRLTWFYDSGFGDVAETHEWDFCSLSCLKGHVGGINLTIGHGGTTGVPT